MNNTGSFGAAAGGMSPELQAAILRRGNQGGATAAVTQGAPGFNPSTQPASPPTGAPPMPLGQQGTPPPPPPAPGQPMPQDASLPFAGGDAIKVIDALSKFLKTFSQPTQ